MSMYTRISPKHSYLYWNPQLLYMYSWI